MISGVMAGVLLLLFLGLCRWAFGARRRKYFEAASQIPLEEEHSEEMLR